MVGILKASVSFAFSMLQGRVQDRCGLCIMSAWFALGLHSAGTMSATWRHCPRHTPCMPLTCWVKVSVVPCGRSDCIDGIHRKVRSSCFHHALAGLHPRLD